MMSPDALALVLGLFSALTLAIANVAVKRGGDILAGRAILSVTSALVVLPFAFIVPLPDRATWAALALALPIHFAYQACLVRALHRADLSLVFPVMRGVAPLMTGFFAWIFLGEALSGLAVLGLLIAALSVASFARPAGGGTWAAHPDRTALMWAAGTSLGVALYSVADARGVRIAPRAETYIVWLFLLDWIGVTSVNLLVRRDKLVETFRSQWRYGATAGILSVLSFGAFLLAMDFTEVARVAALRETGVVFAALLAWFFLKEGFGLRRTFAAAMLAVGLVLLQVAG